ncbi:hypothetical protein [Gimesia maris]|uniref:hypothetical protein n=1 Tax=Gimesia maris TaxID=122 RepID=UPI00241E62D9|nr:hypothetical protein [Gimesia maris]
MRRATGQENHDDGFVPEFARGVAGKSFCLQDLRERKSAQGQAADLEELAARAVALSLWGTCD